VVAVRPVAAILLGPVALAPIVTAGAAATAASEPTRKAVVVRGLDAAAARGHVGALPVRRSLPIVDGFSARLTAGQVRRLDRLPGVQVDPVRRVSITDTGPTATSAPGSPGTPSV
jgi:hypothetical protein